VGGEQPLRHIHRLSNLPLGQIHEKRLLEQGLVRRIPGKRSTEKDGGRLGIVLAARNAPRKIATERRPDFGLALVPAGVGTRTKRAGYQGGNERGARKRHIVSPQAALFTVRA
jgi:hypothetical protein